MKKISCFLAILGALSLESRAAAPQGADACAQTTDSGLRSCRSGAQSDFWLAWGKCANVSQRAKRQNCEKQEVVITRHGKPAGVLIGFEDEDAWFDYQIENDPRFLARVEAERHSMRSGRGVKLEDV